MKAGRRQNAAGGRFAQRAEAHKIKTATHQGGSSVCNAATVTDAAAFRATPKVLGTEVVVWKEGAAA